MTAHTALRALRATLRRPTTPDTPNTTEAANPRVEGPNGVWGGDVVVHAGPRDGDLLCTSPRCVAAQQAAEDRSEPAVEAVAPSEAHVRVIPPGEVSWARWEVVGADGTVRASGHGRNTHEAAAKAELVFEVLIGGGVDGVTL